MSNESSTSKKRTIYELIEQLSPHSIDTGSKKPSHPIIDKPHLFNFDIDQNIRLLNSCKVLLDVTYDTCPLPDDHNISKAISELKTLLLKLIVCEMQEKISV